LHTDVTFIGQPLWGSIGYSVAAALGAGLAFPGRRLVVLVGDGSAIMTAQEFSTILRDGVKPVFLLLNNEGYTVERAIHGPDQVYNDIPKWDWQLLLRTLGPDCPSVSKRVATEIELDRALADSEGANACFLIEIVLPKFDVPELLTKIATAVARTNGSRTSL
jgi:indolepyruvate decarboxylase